MSVVRVGASKKFSDNWESIFGGRKKAAGSKAAPKTAKKSTKKKVAAKLAGKKRTAKKKAGRNTK